MICLYSSFIIIIRFRFRWSPNSVGMRIGQRQRTDSGKTSATICASLFWLFLFFLWKTTGHATLRIFNLHKWFFFIPMWSIFFFSFSLSLTRVRLQWHTHCHYHALFMRIAFSHCDVREKSEYSYCFGIRRDGWGGVERTDDDQKAAKELHVMKSVMHRQINNKYGNARADIPKRATHRHTHRNLRRYFRQKYKSAACHASAVAQKLNASLISLVASLRFCTGMHGDSV